MFRRAKKAPEMKPGVYLDGGFGVGKTHLLASVYHAMPARRKYFGSFIEYTALVGALGYQKTVELFRGADLLCIDEFELDDPGDTMVMTRLLGELVPTGTKLAATSNTPPNALGEGRFAAQDFLREIHAMASSFETLRIDGTDYRQRAIDGHAVVLDAATYAHELQDAAARGTVSDDDFSGLIRHLASVHPSRYIRVIDGISTEFSSDTARSQYRRYLVDENAGTYTEVSSFDVPYSPYVSSAQELDNGNILIDSGMQGLFGQYSPDGSPVAQYRMTLSSSYIYRVYSYDFSGFYFA